MTATIKLLETSGECQDSSNQNGDEMKLSVSAGKFNLRAIIKDNFPSAGKLQELDQKSRLGVTTGQRVMSEIKNTAAAKTLGKIVDKCVKMRSQAGIALVGNQLNRTETSKTAFVAMKGLEFSEMICDEMGTDSAFVSSAPKHYADARKRADFERWRVAECVEIKNCFDNGTFQICNEEDMSNDTKVMTCVFSYKVKTDSDGNETQCKARLNADGRYQCESTYTDTFAPTSRFTNLRMMCALAAQENMKLYQFDVKSAFLIPECKEDIFIQLPGEYRLPKGKVLRLRKMIYGLKNSAYAWSDHFNQWMHKHGYTNIDGDCVTFSKIKRRADGADSRIIIGMHVDDGIVCTNDEGLYEELIADLQKEFTLSSHGPLEWYLGCKVVQDLERGTVTLTQEKYAKDVLERFNMQDAKPVATPCEAGVHLRADDSPPLCDRDPKIVRDYQACIGSLMYLGVFTRGDCAFGINQCARFLNNPGPSHVAAAKRILRYIAGTTSLGLTYRRTDKAILANVLSATADADHAGADDRRSVSGWAVMLNGAAISWASKRQPVTAISSTESEFYSVSQCALECVYVRRIMGLLGFAQQSPTLIAQDNNACIYLTQGARMYHKAKHIDTRIYRVRELSSGANPEIKLWKVGGEHQPSDIFTKALPRPAFEKHRRSLMGILSI